MALSLIIRAGFHTTAGIKPENQDSVNYCIPRDSALDFKGAVAVIADGVSSSEAAKQASETAVKSFIQDYYSTPDTWSTKKSCQQIISSINSWLYKQGSSQASDLKGWVTTFDAIIFKSTTAYLLHIGDSRVYRFRQGELKLLTKDHITWLNKDRSYLSRALGVDTSLQIDFKAEALEQDDLFLLTTDGVHDFITDDVMIQHLSSNGSETEMAQRLVEKAIANQSNDNLTAQVIRIKQLPNETKDEVYNKLSQLPFPPELEPGMKIDGYEITQELNLSARSQIYLAKDLETGKELVLKTPSQNYSDDPWYLDGFVREEWIGQRLSHPGLMKTYRSNRPKQFLYFTTEYIKGQTVSQWIIDHPNPPLKQVRDYIEQLASALRSLHRQDVIHQDLKSDNVMINSADRIKVIDFGAVHAAGLAELASVLERQQPEGTLNYTAPEYMMGERAGKNADLFSLGVITYEMLTGKYPFKEQSIHKFQLKNYSHMSYISVRHYRPDLPEWVDSTLKKACAPDPSKRYQLLSEFLHDLSTPKESQYEEAFKPLLERNPLLFWKATTLLSFVFNISLLIYFLH
ncbi:bifunctional protein-serine/threonine kinase/phosphatase [Thiomicrorhabdus arctica]|uniref:bifunctional protein-serine/threonine kinase/phosphatase n=1 Tax=Thiomicrorhabdus arctica TaxID=131540 RepID=UPI00037F3ECE|nr:bifunctional protein-serine/threonine kinase/phosphatase [Thiomicrorhabdus arctica]